MPRQNKDFIAIGLDYYNGTTAQWRAFQQNTAITYPLTLVSSDVGNLYGVVNDWSIVIDQQGIIRYKQPGVNTVAINTLIDNLLATTGVDEESAAPLDFELKQNFPNPFNPATRIAFTIPAAQKVSLKIYDGEGRLVRTLVDMPIAAGRHEVEWNGLNQQNGAVASGVYFYLLRSGGWREMKKMVLLR